MEKDIQIFRAKLNHLYGGNGTRIEFFITEKGKEIPQSVKDAVLPLSAEDRQTLIALQRKHNVVIVPYIVETEEALV